MGPVARIAAATDWPGQIADKLEDAARRIRAGEVAADQGVLVLRNSGAGRMHEPHRLGMPSTTTEVLGMLAFAQHDLFQREVGGE